MSFLKNHNKPKQLHLQFQGFMEDTYLDVAGELLGLSNFKLPYLQLTESDMSRVEVADNLRLGNRLERFFSFIIKESKQYEIIAENVQIFEDKRITIGEIDFILFDNVNNTYIHIELAGKVYLYDPSFDTELAKWIGPNRRDSLLKKTSKLKEKQFPLLYNSNTKKILNLLELDNEKINQKICLKARLFIPYNLINSKLSHISENNIKGYYIDLNTFDKDKYKAYKYFLPNKQDWIVNSKYGEIWHTYDEILSSLKEFLNKEMSPLVWCKKSATEFESFFIVWWKSV